MPYNEYAEASSGDEYKSDPVTGQFRPQAINPHQQAAKVPSNQSLIQAMMTAYLRKGPGGYTSAAPTDMIQKLGRVNPHTTFGVPAAGIQYGGSEQMGVPNPYSAIFNPAPTNTGNDDSGY